MLKVTFPHMGNAYIPFRILLEELGLDPVVPPPTTSKTIAAGTQLAPEFACFPLKVNLGNYLEALQSGAELILMAGGVGPCRFGYYGELQREILKDAGYNVEFLVLEAPKTHPMELIAKIRRFMPRHQPQDLIRAGYLAWLKAEALDSFDKLANRVRAREVETGITTRIQMGFYKELDQVRLVRDIKKVRDEGLKNLEAIPVHSTVTPLQIKLTGEIFMILESGVNFHIERVLGENGVLVERTIYFTDWVYEQLLLSIVKPDWRRKYHLMAEPYLKDFVGGHGIETVAQTVSASVNGFQGVIELAPFTCMPEIVAMQALTTVTRDLAIPILTLIIDEHSGTAGIHTRIEAFLDLLEYRRNENIKRQQRIQNRNHKNDSPLVHEKEERVCNSI